MESQHMTQQVFAEFIGTGAATLSNIFNDRTRPTLNMVELIKKKLPDINTDWLMFGTGPMYLSQASSGEVEQPAPAAQQTVSGRQPAAAQQAVSARSSATAYQEPLLDFGQQTLTPTHSGESGPHHYNSVRSTRPEISYEDVKYIDKPQRRVTEIRVYYDDQTWESFVPSKK